ncbi:hypothetical protein OESDEN_05913 [Oesophagostomum dentatum]|uniref:Uncharacterized protein n=1 Tax=Oesophagostomum dentatum TaxID=61180 RepID=A0A0B1T9F9_OESDE|nr:hypothetical protein OESDEN_05913 [Oesophagostomum dentatum]
MLASKKTSSSVDNVTEEQVYGDIENYMDQLITKIMTARFTKPCLSHNAPEVDTRLTIQEIHDVTRVAAESFSKQKSLIRLSSAVP